MLEFTNCTDPYTELLGEIVSMATHLVCVIPRSLSLVYFSLIN